MFFINLVGLSSGLACTLLIFLWINDELSIDKFHKNEDRLFQVMEHSQYAEDIQTDKSTSGLLSQSLVTEFPEIDIAVSNHTLISKLLSLIKGLNEILDGSFVVALK